MNCWRILLILAGMTLFAMLGTTAWSQSRRSLPDAGAATAGTSNVVPGSSLVVIVEPGNTEVWAYSKITGQWHLQSLRLSPQSPIRPMAGDVVAMFQAGSRVYAFSAVQGVWDVLDLEEGVRPQLQIMPDWCFVMAGQNVHAFSALAPQWATAELRGQ